MLSVIFRAETPMRAYIAAFFLCWSSLFCAAQEKVAITPESVNSAVSQLDAYVRSSLASTKVPGVSRRRHL